MPTTGMEQVSAAGLAIAVVGLGFGQDFVPIYLSHPAVERVALVEPNVERRREVAERFGIRDTYGEIEGVLRDQAIDAVHILAPVRFHADLAIAALQAGKHCACAVPMATSLADIDRILVAQEAARRNYMMMETAVYGREFLTVEDMYRSGAFGSVTLYRGFHIQNLDGFPAYWQGYPPMHYVTHALAPALALLDTTVARVQCQGAGRLTPERASGNFDNPFPAEVGLFRLLGSDALVDVTVAFFQTARTYIEGFALYGERRGIEWPQDNEGDMMQYDLSQPAKGERGKVVHATALTPRDFQDRLPDALQPFTRRSTVQLPGMRAPVPVTPHHGGSHPHLVHEFISSIVDDRPTAVNAKRAAQWTAPGICAHASALAVGDMVRVPAYR